MINATKNGVTIALDSFNVTTTERDALPLNGMIIYNTTDNKSYGYEKNGAWATYLMDLRQIHNGSDTKVFYDKVNNVIVKENQNQS